MSNGWTDVAATAVGMLIATVLLVSTGWGRRLLKQVAAPFPRSWGALRIASVYAAGALTGVAVVQYFRFGFAWPLSQIVDTLLLSIGLGAIAYYACRRSDRGSGRAA